MHAREQLGGLLEPPGSSGRMTDRAEIALVRLERGECEIGGLGFMTTDLSPVMLGRAWINRPMNKRGAAWLRPQEVVGELLHQDAVRPLRGTCQQLSCGHRGLPSCGSYGQDVVPRNEQWAASTRKVRKEVRGNLHAGSDCVQHSSWLHSIVYAPEQVVEPDIRLQPV